MVSPCRFSILSRSSRTPSAVDEIIKKCGGLWKIKESSKNLKSDLEERSFHRRHSFRGNLESLNQDCARTEQIGTYQKEINIVHNRKLEHQKS